MWSDLMDNRTNIDFQLFPFSTNTKPLIIVIFSILYVLGILLNSAVITVICLTAHLHTPMYLFFCSLSAIDIWCTTVIVPKLLHVLLSRNDLVSFTQCFTQMYLLFVSASVEVLILFVMGCDRYIAICHPLHYHQLLSQKNCTLIMVIILICAVINSYFYIMPLLNLTFNRVVSLHQFFCDPLSVFNASYGCSTEFYAVLCAEYVVLGLCPFLCNLMSYIKIYFVIVHMKSKEGRRKIFSTCSSHLLVMMIYYSSGGSQVISSFHHKGELLNQVLSMFYTTVVPMINPLVYSLRNNEIKKALLRLLKIK